MKRQNKKAAIEMSVGTIVTIVLSMTLLIGLLFFIRSIVSSGTNAITEVDKQIQSQITKLFTEGDANKKVVVYPTSRDITMKKGDEGGFAFSIKNINNDVATFSYTVSAKEKGADCSMTLQQADQIIILGKTGSGINIPSKDTLEDPVLVKFKVPETATGCNIRYGLDVMSGSVQYVPTISVDLSIK